MGFALSSFASTVETYGAISNLVFFPMMLLSGVYFRLDNAPRWMQKRSFRPAALAVPARCCAPCSTTARRSPATAPGLAILGAWAVLSFVLAVRRFRWV